MATTNLTSNVVGIDEAVKASASDTAGFLDAKVDGSTINVVSNQLVRADLTGDVTTVGNAATVVGGNADTVTTNANLTGDVTSVGNATTTVTNADLTGIVTSTGNATAIADGDVPLAKLADGTDGEIPTWDSSGVITTVGTGTADQVLTSNGPGAVPTMQDAAGGALNLISTTTLTTANSGNITIQADRLYLVFVQFVASVISANFNFVVNSDSSGGDYSWVNTTNTHEVVVDSNVEGDDVSNRIEIFDDLDVNDELTVVFHIDTYAKSVRNLWIYGMGTSVNQQFDEVTDIIFSGTYKGGVPTDFEVDVSSGTMTGSLRLYEYAQS